MDRRSSLRRATATTCKSGRWTATSLIIPGTNRQTSEGSSAVVVIDHDQTSYIPGKLQTYACAHSPNQQWAVRSVPGGSNIYSLASGMCVTAISTTGSAVGLDAGTTVTAAQLRDCVPPGEEGSAAQTFRLEN